MIISVLISKTDYDEIEGLEHRTFIVGPKDPNAPAIVLTAHIGRDEFCSTSDDQLVRDYLEPIVQQLEAELKNEIASGELK
jgi:hypothetical protein